MQAFRAQPRARPPRWWRNPGLDPPLTHSRAQYGLRQSPGGHVESQPYDTGYYYVGLGSDFVTFSKRFNEIRFSLGGGNRVLTVRALDGQLVQTDIVIKYRFSFETLYDMFMNYGTSVHDVITRLSRSRLRDVAAQYRSEDFFSRRIEIEEHMRQALVPEFSDRYVTLVALALQRIRLPDDLEEVIESIEISKLDAKLQSEQISACRCAAVDRCLRSRLTLSCVCPLLQLNSGSSLSLTLC